MRDFGSAFGWASALVLVDSEALPALLSSVFEHNLSTFFLHALAESVFILPFPVAWLIRPLHSQKLLPYLVFKISFSI